MRKRIGYGKLGRIMTMDPKRYGPQGDAEAPQLLLRLARRNPDTDFVVIGKYGKGDLSVFPDNVIFPWPAEVPRALWHHLGGSYRCVHCKAVADPRESMTLDCCPAAKAVSEAEQSIIEIGRGLDGAIIHVGQHGSSNQPILFSTRKTDDLTNPQVSAMNTSYSLIGALNAMGDKSDGQAPVSWIITDPRNYLKARDIKWPTGVTRILSQGPLEKDILHDRFGDKRSPRQVGPAFEAHVFETEWPDLWSAHHKYRFAGLELMILPDDWETWGEKKFFEREPIHVFTTSAWHDTPEFRRSWLVKKWVLDQFPFAATYGRWDKKCLDTDGADIEMRENKIEEFPDLLGSVRATVVLPAPNRGNRGEQWTTAKPYQAFAARTAAFFVPPSDTHGWVIPSRVKTEHNVQVGDGLYSPRRDWTEEDLWLADFLRVRRPNELKQKVELLSDDDILWRRVADAQRDLLKRRWDDAYTERILENQMGLKK